VTANI